MSDHWYRLVGHEPVPVSFEEYCRWRSQKDPEVVRVAFTTVGGAEVSTVFLGLDHGWGKARRELFETMTFGQTPAGEELCERWATWAEAEAGHARIVAQLEAGEEPQAV